MMNKLLGKLMLVVLAAFMFCASPVDVYATQTEETEEAVEEREATELTFEIAIFTYEMLTEADEDDMPPGFTLGDWEYNGVEVKAGFTENSDMICVMGEDWETGYQYRFIYDPYNDLFVPYFGAEIKNGYIYTIPMYEDAKAPYGFVDSYFVIQTVPMFTYMREDAELTQEEIAVGSLSEDNYLVFLMMDETGRETKPHPKNDHPCTTGLWFPRHPRQPPHPRLRPEARVQDLTPSQNRVGPPGASPGGGAATADNQFSSVYVTHALWHA